MVLVTAFIALPFSAAVVGFVAAAAADVHVIGKHCNWCHKPGVCCIHIGDMFSSALYTLRRSC